MITVSFSDRRHDDAENLLAGKSVRDVFNAAKTLLMIPEGVKAKLNAQDADMSATVSAGDDVEFVEQSRNKGN